jgi:hypothetical protein
MSKIRRHLSDKSSTLVELIAITNSRSLVSHDKQSSVNQQLCKIARLLGRAAAHEFSETNSSIETPDQTPNQKCFSHNPDKG